MVTPSCVICLVFDFSIFFFQFFLFVILEALFEAAQNPHD